MTDVCVIGRGTAGAEAAAEAAMRGAKVLVIEKSQRPEPPWKTWPELISEPGAPQIRSSKPCLFSGSSNVTLVHAEARSACQGCILTTNGMRFRADTIVAATGYEFEPVLFSGYRKPGVQILNEACRYDELGRHKPSCKEIVVMGEGARALQVAEKLCGGGRRIRMLIPHWRHGAPSPAVSAVLEEAAEYRGVSTTRGTLARAVGEGSLEAILIDGSVVPCDTLVVLPRRVPRAIPMGTRLGRRGGILVDSGLMTSSPGIFAAGGCAELANGLRSSLSLENEPGISGRIAGANAAGDHLTIDWVESTLTAVFGLRWTRVGPRLSTFGFFGSPSCVVSQRWGPMTACTIVFERASGRILGIESVEEATSLPTGIPPLASGAVTLRTLAYRSSSDISLISDTARLALSSWSNS